MSINFEGKPFQKRARYALGFAMACLNEKKPREWCSDYLTKVFGKQNDPIPRFIRSKLLKCVDHSYDVANGKSKAYVRNVEGTKELKDILNGVSRPTDSYITDLNQLAIDWARDQFGYDLESGIFDYEDKSDRLWHKLQQVRKEVKRPLLADNGYKWNYDIVAAAPTLLYQYSTQIPLKLDTEKVTRKRKNKKLVVVIPHRYIQGPCDEYLPAIDQYLTNRTAIRKAVSDATGIEYADVKKIINSLFAGGKLTRHKSCKAFALIGHDKRKMKLLQDNPYIKSLRNDIAIMWNYIKPVMPVITKETKTGKLIKEQLTPKNKWGLYFRLERQVQTSIRNYLNAFDGKYFLEHDGWASDFEIDIDSLSSHVFQETGFRLMFEASEMSCSSTSTSNQNSLKTRSVAEQVVLNIKEIQRKLDLEIY